MTALRGGRVQAGPALRLPLRLLSVPLALRSPARGLPGAAPPVEALGEAWGDPGPPSSPAAAGSLSGSHAVARCIAPSWQVGREWRRLSRLLPTAPYLGAGQGCVG